MATVSELLKEIVPPIFWVPSLMVNEVAVTVDVSMVSEKVADMVVVVNTPAFWFAGVVDITSSLVPVVNDQV